MHVYIHRPADRSTNRPKGGCVSPTCITQTHVVQAARQKRGEITKRAEKYVKEYKKVS